MSNVNMKLPSFFKGFSPLWWWGFLMTKHMTQIICHISRLGYCATKYHHKTNVWQYDLFMPLFIGHYNCCCPLLASIDKEQKGVADGQQEYDRKKHVLESSNRVFFKQLHIAISFRIERNGTEVTCSIRKDLVSYTYYSCINWCNTEDFFSNPTL